MPTCIVKINNAGNVLSKRIEKDKITVGRSPDCDVHLNDISVSRVHLWIYVSEGQIYIEDKGSSNGTFVNNEEIGKNVNHQVKPSDVVQVGTSNYSLMLELDAPVATVESARSGFKADKSPLRNEGKNNNEVLPSFAINAKKSESEKLSKPHPIVGRQNAFSPSSAEEPVNLNQDRGLADAKKQAAKILFEAEAEAERRVQQIYDLAKKTQETAEREYQEKLKAAERESAQLLEDYKNQGHELLQEARKIAQSVRDEVEGYSQAELSKAKHDADKIIAEAEAKVEKMREVAREKGLRDVEEQTQKMVAEAQAKVDSTMRSLALQSEGIQNEISKKKDEEKNLDQKIFELQERSTQVETELRSKEKDLNDLVEEIEKKELHFSKSEQEYQVAKKEIEQYRSEMKGIEEKRMQLTTELGQLEGRKAQLQKDFEVLKASLAEKTERVKAEQAAQEKDLIEKMQEAHAKRLKRLEQDIITELVQIREDLTKAMVLAVESEVLKVMAVDSWKAAVPTIEKMIGEQIESKVGALARKGVADGKSVALPKKKGDLKFFWLSTGAVMSAAVILAGPIVLEKLLGNASPLKSRVASEAQKRRADLAKRKFNPPKSFEVRDSYADSVIYTKNFVELYQDKAFSKRLYDASSVYLLKTWRIDEAKALEVLSISGALIQELVERKEAIHPDFIKEGLEKMQQTETAALARMKEILGTDVRLESFRKFEKSFVTEELKNFGKAPLPAAPTAQSQ